MKAKRNKKQKYRFSPDQLKAMGLGLSGINFIEKINHTNFVKKAEKRRDFLKGEIGHVYEMSKKFVSMDIKNYIDHKLEVEKELIEQYPSSGTIPFHISIGSYGYQDLAVALILCHVDPVSWSFEAVTQLEYEDDEQIYDFTVSFSLVLPAMTHLEFLRGKKDCRIDLGHGLKKVGWKGFEKEILKDLESRKEIHPDSSIKSIEVNLSADVKFINTAAYEEFLHIENLIRQGGDAAENKLRDMWIADQKAGSKAISIGFDD